MSIPRSMSHPPGSVLLEDIDGVPTVHRGPPSRLGYVLPPIPVALMAIWCGRGTLAIAVALASLAMLTYGYWRRRRSWQLRLLPDALEVRYGGRWRARVG